MARGEPLRRRPDQYFAGRFPAKCLYNRTGPTKPFLLNTHAKCRTKWLGSTAKQTLNKLMDLLSQVGNAGAVFNSIIASVRFVVQWKL